MELMRDLRTQMSVDNNGSVEFLNRMDTAILEPELTRLQLALEQISSVCRDEPPGARPGDVVSEAELLKRLPVLKITLPGNRNVRAKRLIFPPSNPLFLDFSNVRRPPIGLYDVVQKSDRASRIAEKNCFLSVRNG